MALVPGFVNLLPLFPTFLAHLAGVVVAIILLVRLERRRTPAILALLGFALLAILDVGSAAQGPLIRLLLRRTVSGIRLASAGVGCCYSIFDVAAAVCLIVAIWQATSGTGAGKPGSGDASATHEEG
jgi:hypothetical protein